MQNSARFAFRPIAAVFALCAVVQCRDARQSPAVRPEPIDASGTDGARVIERSHTADASSVDAMASMALTDAGSDIADSVDRDAEPMMSLPDVVTNPRRENGLEPGSCATGPESRFHAVPMPVVPPELRTLVSQYRVLAARASRCFEPLRLEHVRRPDCRAAINTLRAGGAAAMHAIGQYAYDEQNARLTFRERDASVVHLRVYTGNSSFPQSTSIMLGAENLAAVLASFSAREVVPYILAAVNRHANCDEGIRRDETSGFRVWLSYLSVVTGWDLEPELPWEMPTSMSDEEMDSAAEEAKDTYATWMRWYDAHKNETLEQWRAQGLERARSALSRRDVPSRVQAIIRLSSEHVSAEDREAARVSLVQLLAARRLSNAGRRYMRTLAESAGWQLDADAGVPTDSGLRRD